MFQHPSSTRCPAAVLVTLKASLRGSDRCVLRRAYDEACADAGSIANFSFGRDERCFDASEDLKKLKALPADKGVYPNRLRGTPAAANR